MEGGGRSKRAARPAKKHAIALAKLAEIKRNGGKRGEDPICKEEEAVYDIVEDDEYARIVAKRRDEGAAPLQFTRFPGHLSCLLMCSRRTIVKDYRWNLSI